MSMNMIAAILFCLVATASAGSAWSAPAVPPSPTSSRNSQLPLPPAGAATIKQAQGMDWSGPLLGAAVTGGIFLAVLLLINDDASGPAVTTVVLE